MTVIRTRFLGFLESDPDPTTIEPGTWWFNTSESRWKYFDGSEIRYLPCKVKKATSQDVTIPIGGGIVNISLSASDFGLTKIDQIFDVVVVRKEPIVADVYEASYGINATNDGIGITLAAGSGTTLSAEVTVIGY